MCVWVFFYLFFYKNTFIHLLYFLQIQSDLGKRAPTYLRDLIGRLSAFSDEPRLAGLVGLAVTMVMDVAWSSKQSAGVKGRPAASSSCQVKPLFKRGGKYVGAKMAS